MNRLAKLPPSRRQASQGWKESVTNCVAAMVHTITEAASPVPVPVEVIRSKIVLATRKALTEAPSGPIIDPVRAAIQKCPDLSNELAEFEEDALPGMLRLVILDPYPDWQNAIGAESIMAFVRERAEAEIMDYWQDKIRATVNGMYDLRSLASPLASRTTLLSQVADDIDAALDPAIQENDSRLTALRTGEAFYTGAGMLRLIIGAMGLSHVAPATAGTVRRLADEVLTEQAT